MGKMHTAKINKANIYVFKIFDVNFENILGNKHNTNVGIANIIDTTIVSILKP